MSEAVSWVLMVSVKDGQLEAVREVMHDMVASAQDEPGTTDYDWFVSEDGAAVHIYERFTDSDAVMAHLGSFGENFAERFFGAVDFSAWNAYGEPSSAARAALSGSGAQVHGSLGGFSR